MLLTLIPPMAAKYIMKSEYNHWRNLRNAIVKDHVTQKSYLISGLCLCKSFKSDSIEAEMKLSCQTSAPVIYRYRLHTHVSG